MTNIELLLLTDAINEIEAVLDQYEAQRGTDPEAIYGIFSKSEDRIVRLNVSQLRLVIEHAKENIR